MLKLTQRQRQILGWIEGRQQRGEPSPSARELARHFGFRSPGSVTDHLAALRRKGVLESHPHQARSLRVVSPLQPLRRPVIDIPLYGTIPAGFPEDRDQEARGCISVDVGSLGIRATARTFALEVRGDSMVGRHILDGDHVIFEHGIAPRSGDVVAALIDNENTLKTFVVENGKPYLRAENPRYPKMIPAEELVIQGVMVGLLRRMRDEGGRMKN